MSDPVPPRPASAGSTGVRFLENLAYLVPGYRGYKAKELRREEDSRLRGRVLTKLQKVQEGLEERLTRVTENAPAPAAEALSLRLQRVQGIAHTVRYAPYGFSGFFDAEKVREETLEQVLECDLLLFQDLDEFLELVRSFPLPSRSKTAMGSFLEALDQQLERIETRLVTRDKVLGDR
jgi:hypothetical protein